MVSWRWISLFGLSVFFGMGALGSYTSGLLSERQLSVGFDAEGAVNRVPDGPHIWTDGSLVR